MHRCSPFQIEPPFVSDPWRMLVGCILCNRTRGDTVREVGRLLFGTWPDAISLSQADLGDVHEMINRCGFGEQKAESIQRMTAKWIQLNTAGLDAYGYGCPWKEWDYFYVWNNLPGIGRYAAHSWAVFIEGRRDVPVEDHLLVQYLQETARESGNA